MVSSPRAEGGKEKAAGPLGTLVRAGCSCVPLLRRVPTSRVPARGRGWRAAWLPYWCAEDPRAPLRPRAPASSEVTELKC